MELGDITFIYSGKKDGVQRQGVGLIVNKKVAKSCLGWKGIKNGILVSDFMTNKFRVSVIVVYAHVLAKTGSEDIKSRIAKAQGVFSQLKKSLEE